MSESTAPISGNKIPLLRNMLYRYSTIYEIVNTPAEPVQVEFCAKLVLSMHIFCSLSRYIYICVCVCVCIYIYIYIHSEC